MFGERTGQYLVTKSAIMWTKTLPREKKLHFMFFHHSNMLETK